jgi:hypothetical protein
MALLIRSFVRDPHRIRNLVLAILMPLWLGINLYGMISVAWDHPSFLQILHGMLIWLILADLLFRLFVQKLSLPTLKPWLVLPNLKLTLTHRFILISFFHWINLAWLLFIVPAVVTVSLQNPFNAPLYALCLMMLVLVLNLTGLLLKLWMTRTQWQTFLMSLTVLVCAVVLVILVPNNAMTAIDSIMITSTLLLTLIIAGFSAALFHLINVTIRQNRYRLFATDSLARGGPFISLQRLPIWTRLQFYLILRNKRTVQTLIASVPLLGMAVIYFAFPDKKESFFLDNLFYVILNGFLAMNVGQFIISFDSSYFSWLLTHKVNWKSYVREKYLFMVYLTAVMLILQLFFYMLGFGDMANSLLSVVLLVGFMYPALLFVGILTTRDIDLSQPAFGNWEGGSWGQFIGISFAFYGSLMLYMFLHSHTPEKAFLIFILLAAVPLLFLSLLFKGFAQILLWRKYSIYHQFMFEF